MASNSGLILLCAVLSAAATAAAGYNFRVGGSGEWKVPAAGAKSFNQWAEENRFSIGDSITFWYPADTDAVLWVDQKAYTSCDTSSPLGKFTGGNTVFTFNATYKSYFFISDSKDSCDKGEKLHVVVLADRTGKAAGTPTPTTPSPAATPAAPTPAAPSGGEGTGAGASPPAPAAPSGGENTPAAPSGGSGEATPPAAPTGGEGGEAAPAPPKNGAPSNAVGAAAAVALAAPLVCAFL